LLVVVNRREPTFSAFPPLLVLCFQILRCLAFQELFLPFPVPPAASKNVRQFHGWYRAFPSLRLSFVQIVCPSSLRKFFFLAFPDTVFGWASPPGLLHPLFSLGPARHVSAPGSGEFPPFQPHSPFPARSGLLCVFTMKVFAWAVPPSFWRTFSTCVAWHPLLFFFNRPVGHICHFV